MAMEINSKNLHKYSIPILIVLVGITLLVFLAINKSNKVTIIGRSLTTQVLNIKPSSNGLSSIKLNEPNLVKSYNLSESGKTADLIIEFKN